jgi:cell pole-organizing protein PopZ
MTQPAKGQEPSMEEILASIRRIIADDPARVSQPQKDAASAKPAQLNATLAKDSRPAPEAVRTESDFMKPLSATISPLRAPEHQARDEARAVPLPHVAGTDAETDQDIFEAGENENEKGEPSLTNDDAEAEQAFADPDTEEEHEEPAEQIEEMEASASLPRVQEPPRERAGPVRHLGRNENEQRLMSADTSRAVDSAFNTLAQTVFVQNGPTLEELVKQMLRPMLKAWLDDNLPQLVERLVRAEIERVSRGR